MMLAGTRRIFLKRRNIVLGVLTFAAIYLIYSVARARVLLRNGALLGHAAQRFSRHYFVGDRSHRPLVYLALGDSTAAGWGARDVTQTFAFEIAQSLARRGFRVHVVNIAVGGATLRDMMTTQLPKLQTVRADLVTISIGANDATRGTKANEYSNDLQTLHKALQQSSARQVLWANTPDMAQTPALPTLLSKLFGVRARRQNAMMKNAVADAKIAVVDLHDKGKLIYARDAELYERDLFHPSAKGYNVWAQLFIEKLNLEKITPKK